MIIELYEESREDINILITAEIKSNRDFLLLGRDSGKLVQELKGNWEYEYNLSIRKSDKDILIKKLGPEYPFIENDEDFMNWLQLNYSHNQGFSAFLKLVEKKNITKDLFFWP